MWYKQMIPKEIMQILKDCLETLNREYQNSPTNKNIFIGASSDIADAIYKLNGLSENNNDKQNK